MTQLPGRTKQLRKKFLTNKVILIKISNTMQGISSITQKGQVAIPKSIRDYFKLNPFDKVRFTIENNKIVAEPVLSIKEMRGFIKTKKSLTKKQMKKTIQEAVLQKYANRS